MRVVQQSVTWVQNTRNRRVAYLVIALISAFLIFFPRPFASKAKIVPQDTSSTAASTTSLLGALGTGSQSIGSLLTGGRPSNDLYLIIGRSETVAEDVIKALKLVGPDAPFATDGKAKRSLKRHVDIHLLLGGVMEIEAKYYDADQAQQVTTAYANAISQNLAKFGRQIIQNKQRILKGRFQNATERVRRAEAELNAFRRVNNLAEPEEQLGAAMSQRAALEGQLQAKQVELQTMLQFRGPESAELASIRSDISALQSQISRTTTPSTGLAGPNVAGLTAIQLRYLELYRNLKFQVSIYDVYQKSAEQVEVEELAAESASYIQIIDEPQIDPDRQFNNWAIAIFSGVVLLALFTEWYAPVTGLFGRRRRFDGVEGEGELSQPRRMPANERIEYAE